MFFKRIFLGLVILGGLLVAGCAGALSPLQIAAHPRPTPIAVYPPYPDVVYRAVIELIVSDVDYSAERAAQLAYDHGGYLSSSTVWYSNGQKFITSELAVPGYNFESLRAALIALGQLDGEKTIGQELDPTHYDGYTKYANVTLHLKSAGYKFPPVTSSGWDPLRTLQRAFDVFLTIFGFIVDILIWIVVVAGPFILIGLAGWWLFRRIARSTTH
jgi:hypothetical protein